MAEEFQESEVIFSDHDCNHRGFGGDGDTGNPFNFRDMVMSSQHNHHEAKNNKKSKKMASSAPVRIQRNMFFQCRGDADDTEDEWEDDEKLPPHVIVDRRVTGKMAFSGCTLKGRDLCRVRNSILRMTGFLES